MAKIETISLSYEEARKIQKVRKNKGLKTAPLAKEMGVSDSLFRLLEAGSIGRVKYPAARNLYYFLNDPSLNFLLVGTEDPLKGIKKEGILTQKLDESYRDMITQIRGFYSEGSSKQRFDLLMALEGLVQNYTKNKK
ncbi:helix-turn-helix domain-containing protein [Candidatus Pacearchaeota archaeon]|nr:helix-turn-helix domain-containing protein [Candidatus Pacearchaeota archaeon]